MKKKGKKKGRRKRRDISPRIVFKELNSVKRFRESRFREAVPLLFIFLILLMHVKRVFPPLGKELMYITTRLIYYPNFSYEDKMKEKVGIEYYDWTELVRQHTSVESFVMHPPQMWPWGQSGNPEFSQYFLYPAKLIREGRRRLFDKRDITHVLIAWGEGGVEERLYGWPKFPVFAQKIYYLPQRRKVAVRGLDGLQEWLSDAERTINAFDGKVFDLTYTSSSFDYWIKPVKLNLTPSTKLAIQVKSSWPNSTALITSVSFGKGKFAIFSSSPNQETDEWETLSLNNLYQQAIQFARLQRWSGQLKIEAIGIDMGHPAKMPYWEKWGIIEVERGGRERLGVLSQQPSNAQTMLALANYYYLEGELDKAFHFYQKASLLEPSNPWSYFGLAETGCGLSNNRLAEKEYKEAIELAPETSWFYFALGELYRKEGRVDEAIEIYQVGLNLYPESFWTHLALGEIYEAQGKTDLAYQHYRLAGTPPRHSFSSDGKIAWQKAKKVEIEQDKIIEESLGRIEKDPDDWKARLVLGKAYVVLGQTDEAKKQYEIVYKNAPEKYKPEISFQIPPIIIDQLSQPLYGTKGKAVETLLMETKQVAILDNYHGYIRYPKEFFPIENGTIELSWRPPDDFNETQIPRNLIYQFRGFFVWIGQNKLNFAIFNREGEEWEVISSPRLIWDGGKWYRIGVSYGKRGIYIFLNGKTVGQGVFSGGIDEKNDIFLGRGPLWFVSDKIFLSGYFETIKVYDYQKLKD